MKLTDLSYREYLAIEFLPAFTRHYGTLGEVGDEIAEHTAKYAFQYADAFLRVAGKEQGEVKALKSEIEQLKTQVSVLTGIGLDPSARIALMQIWEFLGVTNQTEAMLLLRHHFPERKK